MLARILLDEMYLLVGLLDSNGTTLEVNQAALDGYRNASPTSNDSRRSDQWGLPDWYSIYSGDTLITGAKWGPVSV